MAPSKSTTDEVRALSDEEFSAFPRTLEGDEFKDGGRVHDVLVDARRIGEYVVIGIFRNKWGTLYWYYLYRT